MNYMWSFLVWFNIWYMPLLYTRGIWMTVYHIWLLGVSTNVSNGVSQPILNWSGKISNHFSHSQYLYMSYQPSYKYYNIPLSRVCQVLSGDFLNYFVCVGDLWRESVDFNYISLMFFYTFLMIGEIWDTMGYTGTIFPHSVVRRAFLLEISLAIWIVE